MIQPPDALGILLDALADRIAARIGATCQAETYDSRNLPPRTSRRRFAEVCRSGRVEDARREGRDWVCSRATWEATRKCQATPRQVAPSPPQPLSEQADRLLARAGLRVVR
jgi:hypothetical protein